MNDRVDSLVAEHFRQTRREVRKLFLKIWGGGFFIVILGFALACFFVQPAPPRKIVIATGPEDGAYYQFASMYADVMQAQGITLEVRPSAGSIQNYDWLTQDNDVELAIVQGGAAKSGVLNTDSLESLASLYFEPVWVFYRAENSLEDLRSLTKLRIAIGRQNSGTAAIARLLLAENGIEESPSTVLMQQGGSKAMQELENGNLDVAIFVLSPSSPIIGQLIRNDDIKLLDFDRHDAYTRRHPFLTSVILERGVIDLEQDYPRTDVNLIAPVANLVATKSLHDALIPLLLRAATDAQDQQSSLLQPGRFPSTEFVEFPVNTSAQLYFENGPPFLQKYLPFWIASAIDRGKILLLPAITLLLPLLRIAPPIYRWRIRSRIYRWYEILRGIESDMRSEVDKSALQKHAETLSEMETELDDIRTVPLSYMEEFYNLRLHVEFVERRIHKAINSCTDSEQD